MQQVPESILQKIQKLMALAERPGTVEEGAAATGRIQELLLKYNLDMATVEGYRPVEKEDIIAQRYDLNEYQTRHDGDFALKLIDALCRFNFCRRIRHKMYRDLYGMYEGKYQDQGDITIIGQPHNVQIVMYMYDYCLNNVKVMANAGWKLYDKSETKIKTVYVRRFFDGAVDAIAYRLYTQRKEAEEVNKEAINAVVLYNSKAVDEKVAQLFPNLTTTQYKGTRSSEIQREGYQAGSSLNLAKGLEGNNGNQRQLN